MGSCETGERCEFYDIVQAHNALNLSWFTDSLPSNFTLLCFNLVYLDGGSPRHVVHERQLSEAAGVVALSHQVLAFVALHEDVVHAAGKERSQLLTPFFDLR